MEPQGSQALRGMPSGSAPGSSAIGPGQRRRIAGRLAPARRLIPSRDRYKIFTDCDVSDNYFRSFSNILELGSMFFEVDFQLL